MPRYFPDELLRRLRNDISWALPPEATGVAAQTSRGTIGLLVVPVATSAIRRSTRVRISAAASVARSTSTRSISPWPCSNVTS